MTTTSSVCIQGSGPRSLSAVASGVVGILLLGASIARATDERPIPAVPEDTGRVAAPAEASLVGTERGAMPEWVQSHPPSGLVPRTILLPGNFEDINPDMSDLDPSDPNGASGGRCNGLASVAGDNQTLYAASEWGGLFKSTDGGLNWFHLDDHVPVATWDVEVDPVNTSAVYATSFFDGKVATLAGIQVSTDAGMTWTHPPTGHPDPALEGGPNDNTPVAGFSCQTIADRTEPRAYGIGIRPDAPANVVIGASCGVARTANSGATWEFRDPTPANFIGARNVWDVFYQAADMANPMGIIDICGDDGHLRSTDGGTTYVASASTVVNGTTDGLDNDGDGSTDEADEGFLPTGRCSIAASPDESYVLLLTVARRFFESDDAGTTWNELGNPSPGSRVPFVATNQRSDDGGNDRFTLWAGGGQQLNRADCITPAMPAVGGTPRCPTSGSWPLAQSGAHFDTGDIVFNTEAANDACPVLYSNDGGVYYNTRTGSDCHDPRWEQPDVTPHALWLYGMEGANQGGDDQEDLYFGLQDNGSWATRRAGEVPKPSDWHNEDCCDIFDFATDGPNVLYQVGFFNMGRGFRLQLASPGLPSSSEVNTYPAEGLVTQFNIAEGMDSFGPNRFVVLMQDCMPGMAGCPNNTGDGGVYITDDITASPIVWKELPNNEPPSATIVDVQAADNGGTPAFFVRAGDGDFEAAGSLWRFDGTDPNDPWTRIDTNIPGGGGVGAYGVDPSDADRLYAATLPPAGPRVVFSTDGGTTWQDDPELDDLMTGGGAFPYRNNVGPTSFFNFSGYPQPSFFALDPEDPNILLAGGRDSGVLMSANGGQRWALVTDPFDPGASGVPHLPRPYFAHFDHEPAGEVRVIVGTQGRGVWRITLPTTADLAITKTAMPDPASPGEVLTYEITIENLGPDYAPGVQVVDVLPPEVFFLASTDGCVEGPSGTLTCDAGDLPAGDSTTFEIDVLVDPNLVPPACEPYSIFNDASVSAATLDPEPVNNEVELETAVDFPLDHFLCYEVDDRPFVRGRSVTLDDRFGPGVDVGVRHLKRMCNPTDKNGEDPTAPLMPCHLAGYEIRQRDPRFQAVSDVLIENQFGRETLTVGRPELLLVPTAKDRDVAPPALVDPTVDHFKCHRVRRSRKRVHDLSLIDQINGFLADVRRPFRLCSPADKNAEGILDPDTHLLCYKIRTQPRRPPFRGPLFISNQFDDLDLFLTGTRELCVPTIIDPIGPPPTPRVTATPPVPTPTLSATPIPPPPSGTPGPTETPPFDPVQTPTATATATATSTATPTATPTPTATATESPSPLPSP